MLRVAVKQHVFAGQASDRQPTGLAPVAVKRCVFAGQASDRQPTGLAPVAVKRCVFAGQALLWVRPRLVRVAVKRRSCAGVGGIEIMPRQTLIADLTDGLETRWMLRRDIESVLRIESAAFDYPWSEADFVRMLRRRNCLGMAVANAGEVVGYMVYELTPTRIVLLNLAVDPNHARRGVGRKLIEKLKSKLSLSSRRRIEVEVGERNLLAQLFFRATGFRAAKIIKSPWPQNDDDAILFVHKVTRKN
jgi:ribosomal-protein-alanine N-acetyltransferase